MRSKRNAVAADEDLEHSTTNSPSPHASTDPAEGSLE